MCQLPKRSASEAFVERATSTAAAASTASATAVNASVGRQAPRAPAGSTACVNVQRRRLRAVLATISATATPASTKSTDGGRTRIVATKTIAAAPMPASSSATDRSARMYRRSSVDDCLIDERAHLGLIVDVAGRHELRQVHHDELLARVDP